MNIKINKTIIVFILLLITGVPEMIKAEVKPEFQLSTRGIMSLNFSQFDYLDNSTVSDFSDSSFLMGFREKLFNNFRAKFVIGFQFPDADSDLGQIFFHQIFIQVENKNSILKIGRSRVRSSLIEFTTLRDDDALHFTDALNPFSSGENTQDSQFGNVFELSYIFGQRIWLRFHGEHFTETPIYPQTSENSFNLNAVGFSVEYKIPEIQRWNRKVLQQIGVSFNNFLTERTGYSDFLDKSLRNIILSVALNLRPDPVHFWDMRHQGIYNSGFSEVTSINSYGDMSRAKSFASFTSLRYLYRKLERPSVQITAAFGFKTFPELVYDTSEFTFISNFFYRLGSKFDVGLQYTHRRYFGDLEKLFGRKENRIQLSFIFNVDASWNNHFDDRDSLLNLEHGYIN